MALQAALAGLSELGWAMQGVQTGANMGRGVAGVASNVANADLYYNYMRPVMMDPALYQYQTQMGLAGLDVGNATPFLVHADPYTRALIAKAQEAKQSRIARLNWAWTTSDGILQGPDSFWEKMQNPELFDNFVDITAQKNAEQSRQAPWHAYIAQRRQRMPQDIAWNRRNAVFGNQGWGFDTNRWADSGLGSSDLNMQLQAILGETLGATNASGAFAGAAGLHTKYGLGFQNIAEMFSGLTQGKAYTGGSINNTAELESMFARAFTRGLTDTSTQEKFGALLAGFTSKNQGAGSIESLMYSLLSDIKDRKATGADIQMFGTALQNRDIQARGWDAYETTVRSADVQDWLTKYNSILADPLKNNPSAYEKIRNIPLSAFKPEADGRMTLTPYYMQLLGFTGTQADSRAIKDLYGRIRGNSSMTMLEGNPESPLYNRVLDLMQSHDFGSKSKIRRYLDDEWSNEDLEWVYPELNKDERKKLEAFMKNGGRIEDFVAQSPGRSDRLKRAREAARVGLSETLNLQQPNPTDDANQRLANMWAWLAEPQAQIGAPQTAPGAPPVAKVSPEGQEYLNQVHALESALNNTYKTNGMAVNLDGIKIGVDKIIGILEQVTKNPKQKDLPPPPVDFELKKDPIKELELEPDPWGRLKRNFDRLSGEKPPDLAPKGPDSAHVRAFAKTDPASEYRFPTQSEEAEITALYGEGTLGGKKRVHHGLDLYMEVGTPLYNPFKSEATVTKVSRPKSAAKSTTLALQVGDLEIELAHLSEIPAGIEVGSKIGKDALVALSGNTGDVWTGKPMRPVTDAERAAGRGAHLHMEARRAGVAIDPMILFAKELRNK